MFDNDYQQRICVQALCGFLLNGIENEYQEGTPIEREKNNAQALLEGLRTYRDRILNTDWEAIKKEGPKNMEIKLEDLCQEPLERSWAQEDLFFEMGFRAGLKLAAELFL